MATGRPTDYTEELGLRICELIATSNKGLHSLSKLYDWMPHFSTIFRWIEKHPSFREQYARARDMQADFLADEILEIADDGSNDTIETEKGDIENREWTNRSRLRVDARKWVASKLKPKKYGEKLDIKADVTTKTTKLTLKLGNKNPEEGSSK